MRLGELFSEGGAELDEGLKNIEITDIVYDSRKVKKGSLFVAIKGFKSDGHEYIDEALEKGAAAAVGQEDWVGERYIKVESSRRFLASASAAFYKNPAKSMKIIGITGTNGKTTISYLIKQILELKGYKCGLIGTNQILIGGSVLPSERTTPESRELQELFARMRDAGTEYVVMEVSSHSLELDRVYGIEFEVGVFTNLTRDHLDFHLTMDNYAAAKARLFSMSRHAVINADDLYAPVMLKNAKNIMTYSIDNESDLRAKNIKMTSRGVIFNIEREGAERLIRLGIPGKFSVYNALGAAGAAFSLGLSCEDVEKGLVLARGVKGRLEVVPTATPFTVIIDYAHTPDGLENVITAVRGFAKKRVITLFGCGGDRDRTKRPIMGEIAERLSDIAIVTSDNPRTEEPMEIIEQILAGMNGNNHIVVENRKEAIFKAMSMAEPDDIVILAGKGHETYQILNSGTIHFDEREVVKECLAKL